MTAAFKIGSLLETEGLSWHREEDLDNPITEGMDVIEAVRINGMGKIQIVKLPRKRSVEVGGVVYEIGDDDSYDLIMIGAPWAENGIVDLKRPVTWYEPVQNSEYAEILNPLCEKYQLAGAMQVGSWGEIVIFQFNLGEFQVADLENETYRSRLVIAEDRKQGKKYYGYSDTRVVCQNTFHMSLSEGVKSAPFGKDAKLQLGFDVEVEQFRVSQLEKLNTMFKTKAPKGAMNKLANKLFGEPEKTQHMIRVEEQLVGFDWGKDSKAVRWADKKYNKHSELYVQAQERRERHIQALSDTHAQYKEELGDTAYALFQAVTDHFTHSNEFRGDATRRQINQIFGDNGKAVRQAYQFCLEL